jgi:hypothetical protein
LIRLAYRREHHFRKKPLVNEYINVIVIGNRYDNVMKPTIFPGFQIITDLPEPLALFFRPGRADHTTLNQLLSENRVGMSGVVFDACHLSFQNELRADLLTRGLFTVLDPLIMEMATPGGLTGERAKLPWANSNPHSPADFDSKKVDRCARLIADCVKKNDFNSVLAPSHYLAHGANDRWLLIDRRLTLQLRRELDDVGCKQIAIYYPLAVPTSVFFDGIQRKALKAALQNLDVNGMWLRVHPFGSHSGGINLQKYIFACQDFHSLKLPLIAEKTGSLGLALLAFGAIAGIESGITSGEQFNFGRLKARSKIKPAFSARPRVYVASLGIFLKPSEAIEFFKDPKLRQYACRDTDCCHLGFDSMIRDPRRHFTFTRMEEVASLSAVPERLRPSGYLQRMLRPADDHLTRVLPQITAPPAIIKHLEQRRRRLHGWRRTLTEMNRSYPAQTFSTPLIRTSLHVRATA